MDAGGWDDPHPALHMVLACVQPDFSEAVAFGKMPRAKAMQTFEIMAG